MVPMAVAMAWFVLCAVAFAQDRYITLASTTSTEHSGLLDYLLPAFQQETGIRVHVVAVGTGKALRMAASGDADVLFVHHTPSEEQFVAEGNGVRRFDVMYNDFVIVGPETDPAKVAGKEVGEALQHIASSRSIFISRGDHSGTHQKELALWKTVGVTPDNAWYRETGSGMGTTLNVAEGMEGYALTDRATWLRFANKGDMKILVEDDPALFNQYGVILVNPARHQYVNANDGQAFIEWLLSDTGQQLIDAYRLEGEQAFFANAAG